MSSALPVPNAAVGVSVSDVVVRPDDFSGEEMAKLLGGGDRIILVPEKLERIAEILSGVLHLRGQNNTGEAREAAIAWFHGATLHGFGKTAFELVSEGKSRAVLEYLRELEDGGYA